MKKLIIPVAIAGVIVALLLTVLNKRWWMKKLRAKFHLPWPAEKDAEQAGKVSLGTLIGLVRTDIDFQGGTQAAEGPPTQAQATRFEDTLKAAGFAW